jgi:ABC-type dipeptide/oligopeptide/nickel transport system permease subunit
MDSSILRSGTASAAGAGGLTGRLALAARDFWRHHRLAAIGAVLVVLFLCVGLAAPVLAPRDPNLINVQTTLQPPSRQFLLGTDNIGRDLLSRIIYGARVSLYISLSSIGAGLVAGVALGTLAAYYGRLEAPIMRLIDMMLAFPGIIVALTVISILGRGVENLIVAIAIVHIPQFARLAHGLTLSTKTRTFVEAAVAIGASDRIIISRYILPNCLPPLIVQTSLLIPGAIMTAASLSFLGLGVPPPTAEWGAMLQNSLQWARLAPHVMVIPGLTLMLAVFGFNVLGDGLRDAMDPRLRRVRGPSGSGTLGPT